MKLEIKEIAEAVRDELLCYEDAVYDFRIFLVKLHRVFRTIPLVEFYLHIVQPQDAEQAAVRWEKEFLEWAEKNAGKRKDVFAEKGSIFLKIKDEDEIFEMADSYMDALAYGSAQ